MRIPDAEAMLNGRCFAHLEFDDRYGTVLVVDYCECLGGQHQTPGR